MDVSNHPTIYEKDPYNKDLSAVEMGGRWGRMGGWAGRGAKDRKLYLNKD